VITSKDEPFQIVWASQAWLELCEFTAEQVVGRTFDLIQGPLTSRGSVEALMDAIREGKSVNLNMINHTSTGKAFSHVLRVEPLCDSKGERQCFQATSTRIQHIPIDAMGAMMAEPGSVAPAASDLPRISSDLAINEMLDLFDNGDPSSVFASPGRSPMVSPAMGPRLLSDENSVVDAFLSMA